MRQNESEEAHKFMYLNLRYISDLTLGLVKEKQAWNFTTRAQTFDHSTEKQAPKIYSAKKGNISSGKAEASSNVKIIH